MYRSQDTMPRKYGIAANLAVQHRSTLNFEPNDRRSWDIPAELLLQNVAQTRK
jgi:hypothetical protein